MKPVMQTMFGGPGSKDEGNCFPACLASLLEIPLEDVPHFHKKYDDDDAHIHIVKWLLSHGRIYVAFDAEMFDKHCGPIMDTGSYYIAGGDGGRGFNHCAIYQRRKLIHDPHPKGKGLLSFNTYEFLFKP